MLETCLTCGKIARYTLTQDLRGKKFYGDWNYCICPFNPGPDRPPQPTEWFIRNHQHKEVRMHIYLVTVKSTLQEHDEADGAEEIELVGSFHVRGDDFPAAMEKAKDLVGDLFEIIGLNETGTEK